MVINLIPFSKRHLLEKGVTKTPPKYTAYANSIYVYSFAVHFGDTF